MSSLEGRNSVGFRSDRARHRDGWTATLWQRQEYSRTSAHLVPRRSGYWIRTNSLRSLFEGPPLAGPCGGRDREGVVRIRSMPFGHSFASRSRHFVKRPCLHFTASATTPSLTLPRKGGREPVCICRTSAHQLERGVVIATAKPRRAPESQSASASVSPVRMRNAESMPNTKTLPSPICPVLAAPLMASTILLV